MKYLFISPTDSKRAELIPITDSLFVVHKDGVATLSLGGRPLMDLDQKDTTELLPFLAEAFNRGDVVTVRCDKTYP